MRGMEKCGEEQALGFWTELGDGSEGIGKVLSVAA
jgi:hypothetical protein